MAAAQWANRDLQHATSADNTLATVLHCTMPRADFHNIALLFTCRCCHRSPPCCASRGEYGRLGIADRTGSSKLRPHKVRGLEGHTVVQVRRGGGGSIAQHSTAQHVEWQANNPPNLPGVCNMHLVRQHAAVTLAGRLLLATCCPERKTHTRHRKQGVGSCLHWRHPPAPPPPHTHTSFVCK